MRTLQKFLSVAALAAAIPGWVAAQDPSQTQTQVPSDSQNQSQVQNQNQNENQNQPSAINQVIDRIVAREQQEITTLRQYTPLIETYIQDMRQDNQLGSVPEKDYYFLGTAYLNRGVVERSLLHGKEGKIQKLNVFPKIGGWFTSGYVPEGFLQMIYIDTAGFNRQNYHFEYVRREFLGEVRCLVFDVIPMPHSGKGRFKGRVWVDDREYAVVRFNGIYTPEQRLTAVAVHFDSWRTNVGPGQWMPTYIYVQESDLKDFAFGHVSFKAQTRLWGYDLKHTGHQEEFSQLTVEAQSQIKDQAAQPADHAPIEAQRAWNRQAEQNVMDRLESAGLIAPTGEVDKVLETVVNNIEVTNNLDVQPEVHCRVLLTSTLESFSLGHTIVISRGLLDVLPDEASLATMLAHELGHVLLGRPLDSQWAFSDTVMFPVEEALQHFNFHGNAGDEEIASKKAIELLKNSPYKDKLQSAGLFLKELDAQAKMLPGLISPHLGNRVYMSQELMTGAPQLQPAKLDQIAALPLGSRIKLDPWSDKVELVKAKPVNLLSEREKMPFEVTPFYPYLSRYVVPGSTALPPDAAKPDVAKKDQQ